MNENTSNTTVEDDVETSSERTEKQRQQLDLVTQQVPFVLTQNIVSHPHELPSLTELAYLNPSYTETTIKTHLGTLIDYGIVEVQTLPEETRTSDLPWRFYGLTDEGYKLLESAKMLRGKHTLKDMFQQVEKTDLIERYADAPRP